MPQSFKAKANKKAGKSHTCRKTKPAVQKSNGWKAKRDVKLTRNIIRNAEEIIIGKAKEAKIRLKIAGQNRVKK